MSVAAEETKPWYKRRWFLAGAGIAALLGFAVVSDLPVQTPLAQQASQDATVIKEIATDARGCFYAIQESFRMYQTATSKRLTAAEAAQVPTILSQDQGACSFTDSSIFDLSSIEVPGTAAGRDIQNTVSDVTAWVTGPALAAIEAIQQLVAHPADKSAAAALRRAESQLAQEKAASDATVDAAGKLLHAHLPYPGLPTLPSPA
jgi:hypothetical protein